MADIESNAEKREQELKDSFNSQMNKTFDPPADSSKRLSNIVF